MSPPRRPVSLADRRELSAILRYLRSTHGPAAMARVIGVPSDSVLAWTSTTGTSTDDPAAWHAMNRLGLAYVGRWEGGEGSSQFWSAAAPARVLEVKGFDLIKNATFPELGWIGTETDSLQLVGVGSTGAVLVKHAGSVVLTLDLMGAVHDVLPADSLSLGRPLRLARPIVVEGQGNGFRIRLVFESVSGRATPQGRELQGGYGHVLAAGFSGRP